ncbi:F-box/WD repeat-containing protein 2 isoform X3 [Cryptotermes secundus]|uniref:F-box/WD repeat-containing protein 2 isoform X3 n=1 Tax=Cryptotermes secundus TaxID=105785 RepID=UPI000CD7B9B6|nr:F-box/WD repeat-containing protein 2 isoform X3 [Cryptotermes secundus]
MKMLEALPIELQEKICSFLDGATLLRATCVSTQWNRIISGLQMVWRQASLREGFGTPVKDWKLHYVTCVRLLQRLKKGKAFQHRHFAPKCFQCSDVRDVVFWNGCILAGIKKCIRVWRVEDLKPAAVFDVPYEIFCLSVSFNNHVLGVGHYDGAITTWLLDEVEVRASLLQCYVGHRDNVVCLCVAPELNLMCSGSRDSFSVRSHASSMNKGCPIEWKTHNQLLEEGFTMFRMELEMKVSFSIGTKVSFSGVAGST